ncbi:MAG: DNA primase, partial [Dehalococcoidia bacterium]|nr:DNA primase [Dehalococcoidia bacterium]
PAPAVLGRPRGYVATALERELDAVATAAPGTRNDSLNRASFNVGTLVDSYGLDLRGVADALLAAALHAGLDDREARAAIRSGLHAGRQHPRRAAS